MKSLIAQFAIHLALIDQEIRRQDRTRHRPGLAEEGGHQKALRGAVAPLK